MLVKFGHDEKADDPFVINPARADPAKAKAHQYPNWKGWCMAANINSPTPHRLICATVVVCLSSHIIEPMRMTTILEWMIKEFLGVPEDVRKTVILTLQRSTGPLGECGPL